MDVRASLNTLRSRMIAADLRSRSIRLSRCTKSGAFDIAPLATLKPEQAARLLRLFGGDGDATADVINPKSQVPEEREFAARLLAIARAARATWLETGAEDLALGWPMCEAMSVDGTWLRAPLLLMPVTVERHQTRATLVVKACGPVELNAPFARVLAREFGATLSLDLLLEGDDDDHLAVDAATFSDLVTTMKGLNLRVVATANAVDDTARWRLEPIESRTRETRGVVDKGTVRLAHSAVIGRFPRSGSQLVSDYDEMLNTHPVAGLGACSDVLSTFASDDNAEISSQTQTAVAPVLPTDDLLAMRQWQVVASDKSQDAVFRAVFANASDESERPSGIVVQGPPGTGKSQMLANVLAAAIATGKKTLVVCQKRAALDVVAKRLEAVGLQDGCVVVHDTARDRPAVANAIAQRLGPILDAGNERQRSNDKKNIAEHGRLTATYRAHLMESQKAYAQLCEAPPGRPPLIALLEDALDDSAENGAENGAVEAGVDLGPVIAGVTEDDVALARVRMTALAPRFAPLARPHPLYWRKSFADQGETEDLEMMRAVRRAHAVVDKFADGEEQATKAGAPVFGCIVDSGPEFDAAATALEALANKDGHHLRLFWSWTGGEKRDGDWARVQTLLREAHATFVDVSRELVSAPQSDLDTWNTALDAAAPIADKWDRFFRPTHWRMRRAIGELAERTHSDRASREAALTQLASAKQWRTLIAALPDDNCFLEVGITGSLDDLALAIDQLARDHAHVQSIHSLAEALDGNSRRSGSSVAANDAPLFTTKAPACDVDDDPWTLAALGAFDRYRRFLAARRALAAIAHHFDPVTLKIFAHDLERGDGRALADALLAFANAATDVESARVLDRETKGDPAFLVYFLRRFRSVTTSTSESARSADAFSSGEDAPKRGGITPGDALGRSARRAFLDVALNGRESSLLSAPLVSSVSLDATERCAKKCRAAAAAAAAAALRERVAALAQQPAGGKALRHLLAQAQKKRRRAQLRTLTLEGDASGLFTLIPVWLCSPDSVAHLFAAQSDAFDLVIFDEASQCPVEAGVPALWRGKFVVVAGDDQQMPPSHFFSARDSDEDDDEEDDVVQSASLLALCRRALPSRSLAYHYRSLDDSLIAFSNAAFYQGQLTVAPHVHDVDGTAIDRRRLGFRYRPVGGFWKRQQNSVEADAIVDEVERSLTLAPHLSVGVVCMNRPQADLIEERLEARANDSAPFAALLAVDRARPPTDQLFVRNLENVQGDERDVILFSIGYGREKADGPVRARLGPLALEGGEKRLNVAVTRAKQQIVVVLSFAPEEMDVSRSKHIGPKLFQLWLQYARAGSRNEDPSTILATAAEIAGRSQSSLVVESDVLAHGRRLFAQMAKALGTQPGTLDLGWNETVGVGREKIDFVRGSTALDVTTYWSEPDAIARDVTGRAFWRRAGFEIERLTPSIWLLEKDRWISD